MRRAGWGRDICNHALRRIARWSPEPLRKHVVRFASRCTGGCAVAEDDLGARFFLDLDNYIDNRVFLRGGFELDDIRAFLREAEDAGCTRLIDIGANIGLYSIHFARRPWIERVDAFEPDPRNFEQLVENAALNDAADTVRTHAVALSDRSGTAPLHLGRVRSKRDRGKWNTGTSSLERRPERHDASVDVALVRLDDVLSPEGETIAVKIDVEGHEDAVLRGMERLLARNTCVVLAEVFPENRDARVAFFEERGYVAREGVLGGTDNHLFTPETAGARGTPPPSTPPT